MYRCGVFVCCVCVCPFGMIKGDDAWLSVIPPHQQHSAAQGQGTPTASLSSIRSRNSMTASDKVLRNSWEGDQPRTLTSGYIAN
jgi:hypothetical protein